MGSRSTESASAFVDQFIDADQTLVRTYVKTYGSYAGVYSDPVCRDLCPPPPPVSSADDRLLGRRCNLYRSVVTLGAIEMMTSTNARAH